MIKKRAKKKKKKKRKEEEEEEEEEDVGLRVEWIRSDNFGPWTGLQPGPALPHYINISSP
jgi:hypothetical protein